MIQIYSQKKILVSIVVGQTLLLFIPSLIIMKIENWSFIDSLYFSYITLYTVGLGDYVAGNII